MCAQGAATASELWQANQLRSDIEENSKSEVSHQADSHLVPEVARLKREKSLAEARACELAEELQQRDLEMEDLEKIFSESMAPQRRDFAGIGSNPAGSPAMGLQLPPSSQDDFKAPIGRTLVEGIWASSFGFCSEELRQDCKTGL